MKKILFLTATFLVLGTSQSYAQENFKIGANIGLPVGDTDVYDINFGADLAYLFGVGEGFGLGPMIGYSNFTVEEFNASFLPVAATGRYEFSNSFFLGADLGYAIGLEDGLDGGIYYRPKLGYNFGILSVIASYAGISVDGGTWSSINAGVEFSF